MNSLLKDQVIKSLSNLYSSGAFSDITFLVEGQELKAHKNILASRNEVFQSMFLSDMSESKKNVIELDDDIDTFKTFLKYLYTGTVEDDHLTLELFILADKYLDQALKDLCENSFCEIINSNNAVKLLLFANRYDCLLLKMQAASYVANHMTEFLDTPKFGELLASKDVMKFVLKQRRDLETGNLTFFI